MTKPIHFLSEVRDELKKVIWPTRKDVIRLTGIVISISLIVALYIGGLDALFTKLTEIIIQR